jgi:hypothetical protein
MLSIQILISKTSLKSFSFLKKYAIKKGLDLCQRGMGIKREQISKTSDGTAKSEILLIMMKKNQALWI